MDVFVFVEFKGGLTDGNRLLLLADKTHFNPAQGVHIHRVMIKGFKIEIGPEFVINPR